MHVSTQPNPRPLPTSLSAHALNRTHWHTGTRAPTLKSQQHALDNHTDVRGNRTNSLTRGLRSPSHSSAIHTLIQAFLYFLVSWQPNRCYINPSLILPRVQ